MRSRSFLESLLNEHFLQASSSYGASSCCGPVGLELFQFSIKKWDIKSRKVMDDHVNPFIPKKTRQERKIMSRYFVQSINVNSQMHSFPPTSGYFKGSAKGGVF